MTRIQIEGMNSVYEEPKISSTIKENPYAANTELEGKGKGRKGEVVLRPDGVALHDVVGKRHYAGGVETWLPEGSFVFSDFKDLAFTQRDHKLFELKEGGTYRKGDNTPAEVLRRNIDVKHYNKMSNTLEEKHKDGISKNTAALMLEKYQEKLGQIALLQESKKGFPEGEPAFSQGTAPVYEGDLKEDIMEQKQYMRSGGQVLPKYQGGATVPTWGYQKPTSNEKRLEGINGNYIQGFHGEKVWVPFNKTSVPQQTQTSSNQTTVNTQRPLSGAAQDEVTGFGSNPQSPTNPYKVETPSWWPKESSSNCPPNHYWNSVTGKCTPNSVKKEEQIIPSKVEEGISSPIEMPWQFTPWQKYSMGLGFKNYAGINRLMPMRSQINSPLVELERMVEPSYLGELAAGFRGNQVMNPYLAGVNNAQMYGQMLNADRQSNAQNINQNVQIGNQQNLINNQIQRQDLQTNIGADQQYYNQVQQSKGNFDNMRSTVREQNRAELMGNVQGNEQLAMAMARLGKDRPFDYNFKTGQIYHTGRGDIMSANTQTGQDTVEVIAESLIKKGMAIDKAYQTAIGIAKIKSFNSIIPQFKQKTGGYNPYRK
jgi:hypothetical protein